MSILSLWLSVFLSMCLSLWLSVFFLGVCPSGCLTAVSLAVCLSVLSVLPFSFYLDLQVLALAYLPYYLFTPLPACHSACRSLCLPVILPVTLLACLSVWLPVSQSACHHLFYRYLPCTTVCLSLSSSGTTAYPFSLPFLYLCLPFS